MVCSTNGPERTGPLAKLEVLKTLFITSTCVAAASYKGSNCILVLAAGSTKGFQSEASEEILGIRTSGYNLLISDGENTAIFEKIVLPRRISNCLQESRLRTKISMDQRANGYGNYAIAEAWLQVHIKDLMPRIGYGSYKEIENCLKQAARGAKTYALSQKGDDRRIGLKLAKGLEQMSFINAHYKAIKDARKAWLAGQPSGYQVVTSPLEDLVDNKVLRILKKIK